MSGTRPQPKRQISISKPGINSLMNAANTDDRFNLLDDANVPPSDLDNPIHAIFYHFEAQGPLKQGLRLASHFLQHDSTLAFFVPLLYGNQITDPLTGKSYLSDPLAMASYTTREQLIAGVEKALQMLARRIYFCFTKHEKEVYARTMADRSRPACCHGPAFQGKISAKIEITDRFNEYYHSADGYAAASRCAQFRHDFLFATTLVHEVVHAFGVLRRGTLVEPFYRLDCPDTEWGYAWEHFMFGCIINPQERSKAGTNILMRKMWSAPSMAEAAGGKEYCDVSMPYIAQWFRNETWRIVEKKGPTAIPAPVTHFKIQVSQKYGAWVVTSDCAAVQEDVRILHREWVRSAVERKEADILSDGKCPSYKVLWQSVSAAELQKSNVITPMREVKRIQSCPLYGELLPRIEKVFPVCTPVIPFTQPPQNLVAACRASTPSSGRKRRAEEREDGGRTKRQRKQ